MSQKARVDRLERRAGGPDVVIWVDWTGYGAGKELTDADKLARLEEANARAEETGGRVVVVRWPDDLLGADLDDDQTIIEYTDDWPPEGRP